MLKLLKWVKLGCFSLLKDYEISLLEGNWVSELKSPGAIKQDEELDCLVQSLKKRERANSTFLKVREKKKTQAENISQVFQFS